MTSRGHPPPPPADELPLSSSPPSPPQFLGARRVLCSETGRQLLSLPLGRHSATASTADFVPSFSEGSFWPATTTANTTTATTTAELHHGHLRSKALVSSTASRRSGGSRRRLEHSRFPLRASVGTHYVHARVGTPPQTVTLIIDTGSFTTAFPCAGCVKCRAGKDQSFWDPGASATALDVSCDDCQGLFKCAAGADTCSYRQRYSEGSSWMAYQIRDVFRFGMEEAGDDDDSTTLPIPAISSTDDKDNLPMLSFGCIQKQSGLFDHQEPDGIIGMGPHKDSMVWELTEQQSPQFSLCFSTKGGSMVLGGYDSNVIEPGEYHEYTPVTLATGFYVVEVVEVKLGGRTISDDVALKAFGTGGGTIVDSGTTDTYLPEALARSFLEAWQAATGRSSFSCPDESFCMRFTREEVAKLPVFSLTLYGDTTLEMSPLRYLDRDQRGYYTPRIYLTEIFGAVIGANMLMDRNVVFDLDKERLGFAKANCDGGVGRHAKANPSVAAEAATLAGEGYGDDDDEEQDNDGRLFDDDDSDDDDDDGGGGEHDDRNDNVSAKDGRGEHEEEQAAHETNVARGGVVAPEQASLEVDGEGGDRQGGRVGEEGGRGVGGVGGRDEGGGGEGDSASSGDDSEFTAEVDAASGGGNDKDKGNTSAPSDAREYEEGEGGEEVGGGGSDGNGGGGDSGPGVGVSLAGGEGVNAGLEGTGEALGATRDHGEAAGDGKHSSGGKEGGVSESGERGRGDEGAREGEGEAPGWGVTQHATETGRGKSGETGVAEKEATAGAVAREDEPIAAAVASPDDLANFTFGHSSKQPEDREVVVAHEGAQGEGRGAEAGPEAAAGLGEESNTGGGVGNGGGDGGGGGGELESGGGETEETAKEDRSASLALGTLASAAVVDCELELVKESPCEAECPPDSLLPVTVDGIQYVRINIITRARGGGTPCPIVEDGDGAPLLNTEPCSFTCGAAADAATTAGSAGKVPEIVPDVDIGGEGGMGGGDAKGKGSLGNGAGDKDSEDKGAQHEEKKSETNKNANYEGAEDKDDQGQDGQDHHDQEGQDGEDQHDQEGQDGEDQHDQEGQDGEDQHDQEGQDGQDKDAQDEGGRDKIDNDKDGKHEGTNDESAGKGENVGGGGGGGGGGVGPDWLKGICVPGSWGPCGEVCEQERYEREGCTGKREVRPCHIGNLCPSASEGLYVELPLTVHVGFDDTITHSIPDAHRGKAAVAMAAAAEAAKVHPSSSWEGLSMAEMRWRRRIGDVLADAVATRLLEFCGVFPGDVAFYLLPSSGDGAGGDGGGKGGDGGSGGDPLDVVLASLHILDDAAESKEQMELCTSALANPAIASELTSLVGRQLIRAGGEGGGREGTTSDLIAPLAGGFKVVETGRVTVRAAPSEYRMIDNNAVGVVVEGKDGGGGGVDTRAGRPIGGGSGSGSKQGLPAINPWPPSGLSADTVFAFQATGVITLLGVLLLAQRCRSTSRGGGLTAPWRRRRGGRGGSGSPASAGDAGGDAVRYRRKTGSGQTGKGEHSA